MTSRPWLVSVSCIAALALPLSSDAQQRHAQSRELPASVYLQASLHVGQTLKNVFSRTISFKGDGFDELAFRVSGTATYVVTAVSPSGLQFDGSFRYDGRPESHGKTEINDGGRTACYEGKCSTSTDASGLLYNPLIWGEPKGGLHPGTTWNVSIPQPWELGPSGEETVTVVEADPENHAVTLKREGSGDGFFAGENQQIHVTSNGKTYLATLVPGRAHWIGFTRFREGVVISDELVVERAVTLDRQDLGSLPAQQREYILLNASPSS